MNHKNSLLIFKEDSSDTGDNSDIKEASFTEKIYHIPIYFFNNYEKNSLLAIKELLKNPENYFTEFRPM